MFAAISYQGWHLCVNIHNFFGVFQKSFSLNLNALENNFYVTSYSKNATIMYNIFHSNFSIFRNIAQGNE